MVQFPFELFAPLPVGGLHPVGGQGRTNAKVPSCRAGAFGLHPNCRALAGNGACPFIRLPTVAVQPEDIGILGLATVLASNLQIAGIGFQFNRRLDTGPEPLEKSAAHLVPDRRPGFVDRKCGIEMVRVLEKKFPNRLRFAIAGHALFSKGTLTKLQGVAQKPAQPVDFAFGSACIEPVGKRTGNAERLESILDPGPGPAMVRQYGEAAGPIRVQLLGGNAPVGRPFAGGREVNEEKIPPVFGAKEAQVVPNLVLPVAGVRFVFDRKRIPRAPVDNLHDDIDFAVRGGLPLTFNGNLAAFEADARVKWCEFLQRQYEFPQKKNALTVGGLWVQQIGDDSRQAQFVRFEVIEHVVPARLLPIQFQFSPSRGGIAIDRERF